MTTRGMQREGRKILAEFWCDESLKLELRSVTVLAPYVFHDQKVGEGIDRYEVELSKTYGYLYDLSGGGGAGPEPVSGIYWCSPGFPVKEGPTSYCSSNYETGHIDAGTRYIRMRNRTRRLVRLPKEFRKSERLTWPEYPHRGPAKVSAGDLMDWLERHAINQDAVYCSACDDWLPSEELCAHCWWCESVGWYVTPSEGSVCFDADCQDCSRIRRGKHEAYRDKKRRERWQARRIAKEAQRQEVHPQ